MNTSRSMAISGCRACQSARAAATSGRACSLACAVFFDGDVVAIEEAAEHAWHEALAVCGKQMLADLDERDIRRFLGEGKDLRIIRLDPSRAPVATLRTGLAGARQLPLAHQLDHGRWCDAETGRGRPAAHALFLHRPDDATAKVRRQRFGHEGWPPAPALSMNH